MFDVGKTDPESLYDFAITLDSAHWSSLDPDSELYQAFKAVHDSAWKQLPELIVLDFRDPDTFTTPKPPLSFIWDETSQRYI